MLVPDKATLKSLQKETAALRVLLFGTINDVRSGKIEPVKAASIGNLCGKVMSSRRLNLDVEKFYRRNANSTSRKNGKAKK